MLSGHLCWPRVKLSHKIPMSTRQVWLRGTWRLTELRVNISVSNLWVSANRDQNKQNVGYLLENEKEIHLYISNSRNIGNSFSRKQIRKKTP